MRNLGKVVVLLVACFILVSAPGVRAEGPQQQPSQTQAAPAQKSPAASLGVFPYPTKGQDAAQQQKDEGECYSWAKQQTGIDPAAPPPPPAEAKQAKGGAVKGAAKGAAGGAAVGAIAGDTGDGAAIGATAGAVRGRRQQKKANKQAQQQAQAAAGQQQQQTLDTFKKAFGGCMDGRGYSVK
ncbi:MAG TPA: glycine zipper family protein [Terriglobia bacterium]|nr:glycine zipper family protein [Terriglobia bacterium]